MTRKEQIKEVAQKEMSKYPNFCITAPAFRMGAEWADAHPNWISVEDELPKISWTMSDTVVVTDGNGGLRLAWYHQDEGWHFATGLTFEPTHWMYLPQAPKKGGEE